MMHPPPELILFELIIVFSAITSIQRRRAAITSTLKHMEGECVAVVSKRMRSVKIYFDKPTEKIVDVLIGSKKHVTNVNLKANKKSIILKQSDGSLYIGDTYWHQTIEKYFDDRANRNLRRLALLKYNDIKDGNIESHGTLDKVYNTNTSEYHGKRLVSCRKRKNYVCKLCPNKHVGFDTYCCYRNSHAESTVIVVEDAIYSKPGISGSLADNRNVVDGRGACFSSYYSLQNSPFMNFQTRLSTFKSWRSHINPRCLAENGFFYIGVGDTAKCYSCGVALKNWDQDDDPLLEHIRYSPTCNHLENTVGRKNIQEYLDQFLKDHTIQTWFNAGVITMDVGAPTVIAKPTKNVHRENTLSLKSARSPEYQSVDVRLSSFAKFPNHNEISIRDVAEAGFYYTGLSDLARCYWCDLGLKAWEHGDDPYKEHARYLPDCDHLRRVKGEDFIRHIQNEPHVSKRRSPSESPREHVCSGEIETKWTKFHEDAQKRNSLVRGQISEKQKESTNVLATSAAQSVLEHGYTDELVLAAIRKLNIADETELTAIKILEVIFEAEENGTDLTEKTVKYGSQKYQSMNVQSANEEIQQLIAENQKLKSLMLCKYCQAREKNILVLPCSHRNLCHECANKSNLCPECWKPIKERVRTYMA
ncbi:hypothetical protein ACJMK2_029079 [Sinanodonta woodiana]|uniref:RING-type domain-containing protein n=1 Tax=Sinanodonta woodiana TaxID=1069815 RepID=A0ABD3XCP7_SINWO